MLPFQEFAACYITSGTFNFPEDPMTPMLMAGLGTGLAPFRAFAQERKWMQDVQKVRLKKTLLLTFCRNNERLCFSNN